MSEFLVTLLRIAYLAILWIFILFVTNVIRTDIYGHRVPRNAGEAAVESGRRSKGRRTRRREPAPIPTGLQVISGSQAGTFVPLANGVHVRAFLNFLAHHRHLSDSTGLTTGSSPGVNLHKPRTDQGSGGEL